MFHPTDDVVSYWQAESDLEQTVLNLILSTFPPRELPERRRGKRHPFPIPLRLFPADAAGEPLDGVIPVVGKFISPHGLDFYSRDPIAHRRAIVQFSLTPGQATRLLMDLSWCRFGRHGWYENGGRFLRTVS